MLIFLLSSKSPLHTIWLPFPFLSLLSKLDTSCTKDQHRIKRKTLCPLILRPNLVQTIASRNNVTMSTVSLSMTVMQRITRAWLTLETILAPSQTAQLTIASSGGVTPCKRNRLARTFVFRRLERSFKKLLIFPSTNSMFCYLWRAISDQ